MAARCSPEGEAGVQYVSAAGGQGRQGVAGGKPAGAQARQGAEGQNVSAAGEQRRQGVAGGKPAGAQARQGAVRGSELTSAPGRSVEAAGRVKRGTVWLSPRAQQATSQPVDQSFPATVPPIAPTPTTMYRRDMFRPTKNVQL